MSWRDRLLGAWVRRLRVLPAAAEVPHDPHSPAYLYLVQQSKRLSLARALGRFTLANILVWPLLILVVLVRWVDLAISNTLIRALINEYDLARRAASPPDSDRR